MKLELRIPSVGESIVSGSIARWLKKTGDFVKRGEDLFEFESEKASMPIPSPAEGVLEILVPEGTEVTIGQLVANIDGDAAPALEVRPAPEAAPRFELPPASPPVASVGAARPAPAPRVVPVPTPGPAPEARPAFVGPRAASTGAATTGVTRTPMSRIRKTIARRLVQARSEAAHLTTFNEVDMSAVIQTRKRLVAGVGGREGVKLGFMSFFVKAVVAALKEYPIVNSRIEGEEIVTPEFYDVGVAVSTERGLLVPVLRNVDRLNFSGIEAELAELATKAREGRIGLEELQGGSFTITNGGVFGSLLSTPIPNYPQSAILGMHAIQDRPVAVAGAVEVRPMMYLALTYDHRLIDGRDAVLFLVKVKERIEDPERLVLGL
jgi:2-oxoglutarate dehydrogenase E2 component (dihydrolipoamide succinyltransferase)